MSFKMSFTMSFTISRPITGRFRSRPDRLVEASSSGWRRKRDSFREWGCNLQDPQDSIQLVKERQNSLEHREPVGIHFVVNLV